MTNTNSPQTTNRRQFGRRLRLFAVAIAGTAGLAGAGLAVTAGTAGAEPNICITAKANYDYYMAEYEVILPDSGYQPSLTEVHQGLTALHQAQMWRSIGRGFGC